MTDNRMVSLTDKQAEWLEAQKEKGNRINLSHVLRQALQELIEMESGEAQSKLEITQEAAEFRRKTANLALKLQSMMDYMNELAEKGKIDKDSHKFYMQNILNA